MCHYTNRHDLTNLDWAREQRNSVLIRNGLIACDPVLRMAGAFVERGITVESQSNTAGEVSENSIRNSKMAAHIRALSITEILFMISLTRLDCPDSGEDLVDFVLKVKQKAAPAGLGCYGLWTFRPVLQRRTNSMMESEFRDYLRSLHRRDGGNRFQERTVQNRVSNCKNVERYEGDLDQHFDKDQCRDLLQRLSYSAANHDTNNPPDHKIPIDGDIRTGSATLKSAVKLYAEFRQRQFLNVHWP